jgi:hypothetical protein
MCLCMWNVSSVVKGTVHGVVYVNHIMIHRSTDVSEGVTSTPSKRVVHNNVRQAEALCTRRVQAATCPTEMWNAYTRSLSTFHLRWWQQQHDLQMLHFIVHQVVWTTLRTFAYKLQAVTGQHVRNLLWPHLGNLFLISSSIVLRHEIRNKYRRIMERGQGDSWRLQCLEALHGCPMLHKE